VIVGNGSVGVDDADDADVARANTLRVTIWA